MKDINSVIVGNQMQYVPNSRRHCFSSKCIFMDTLEEQMLNNVFSFNWAHLDSISCLFVRP